MHEWQIVAKSLEITIHFAANHFIFPISHKKSMKKNTLCTFVFFWPVFFLVCGDFCWCDVDFFFHSKNCEIFS